MWLVVFLTMVAVYEIHVTSRPPPTTTKQHSNPLEFTLAEADTMSSQTTKSAPPNPPTTNPPSDLYSSSSDSSEASPASSEQKKIHQLSARPTKPPTTAPTSPQQLPLCTRSQVIQGKWKREILKHPPYITPTKHLRCFERDVYYADSYVTYKWHPTDKTLGRCSFKRYNPTGFCKLTKRLRISIIGDSLSWEQYSSLLQLQGRHVHQNFQHQSRELHQNIVQNICHNQTSIVYRRDDKLSNVSASLREHAPHILILNRGAHYEPDDQHLQGIRKVIADVRQWLNDCPQCRFFWRTSVPGHPGCQTYSQPINDRAAMESIIANRSNYDDHTLLYHWYDYQHQNELTLKELQKSGLPFHIIDAYHLNVLRPDEHRAHQGDCLHNCYPGKMDVYNQLLYHYLSQDGGAALGDLVSDGTTLPILPDTVYDPVATEEAKKIREATEHHHSLLF